MILNMVFNIVAYCLIGIFYDRHLAKCDKLRHTMKLPEKVAVRLVAMIVWPFVLIVRLIILDEGF